MAILAVAAVIWLISLFIMIFFRDVFPNDSFKYLDRNDDNVLSRKEWIALSAGHYNLSTKNGTLRHFDIADCDIDGRLTWEEYKGYRLSNYVNPCDRSSTEPYIPEFIQIVNAQDSLHYYEPPFPFIYETSLLDDFNNSRFRFKYLADQADSENDPYIEQVDHKLSELQELSCSRKDDRLADPNQLPAISCKIENHSRTDTLSLAVFSAVEMVEGIEQTNILVKPLSLPPQSSKQLTILFSSKSTPLSVSLITVRKAVPLK